LRSWALITTNSTHSSMMSVRSTGHTKVRTTQGSRSSLPPRPLLAPTPQLPRIGGLQISLACLEHQAQRQPKGQCPRPLGGRLLRSLQVQDRLRRGKLATLTISQTGNSRLFLILALRRARVVGCTPRRRQQRRLLTCPLPRRLSRLIQRQLLHIRRLRRFLIYLVRGPKNNVIVT
jgi:hypothetical protein